MVERDNHDMSVRIVAAATSKERRSCGTVANAIGNEVANGELGRATGRHR